MAKGSKTTSAPRGAKGGAKPDKVGPPLLILGLGYASILVSLPLIAFDSVAAHVVGYITGALIPILVIGFVRRIDLDRRRSPYYEASSLLPPAIAVLGVAAVVAAGLHVWPIATELAS
ncbi:MAG: hypothetical protein U0P45_16030 [Acidimicrobiales bacterium]